MAEIQESESLRDKLKKKRVPVDEINKFLAYVRGAQQQEATKEANKRPVTNNTDDMLYTMFIKFWNLGLTIDGVNVVITGRAMAMVTFHGYKNKVRKNHPTAKFDIQLVRSGDEFKVRKDSGRVEYTHEIADPFGSGEIKGAYCVISIDGRDYFEALNKKDYDEMQKGSKQSYLWDKWDSEFWLKSVIKRACKRHFYDEVKDIDRVDNEDYGQSDGPREATTIVGAANTKDEILKRLETSKKNGTKVVDDSHQPTNVPVDENGNVS